MEMGAESNSSLASQDMPGLRGAPESLIQSLLFSLLYYVEYWGIVL